MPYGEETEVTEEGKDPNQAPVRNVDFYKKWLKGGKDASRTYWSQCKAAWREYLNIQPEFVAGSQLKRQDPKRYPIYWSSMRTVQPAYYSRMPIPEFTREFDNEDAVARVACTGGERLSNQLMRMSPYNDVMCSGRDEYLMTDRATIRVIFEATIKERINKFYVEPQQMPDGSVIYVSETGEEAVGQIEQDENGLTYISTPEEYVEDKKIFLQSVMYQDIVHTPYARSWDEIEDIGFRSVLNKEQFIKRFGPEKAALVSFTARVMDDGEHESQNVMPDTESVAEVWEIWCKNTKTVYWICSSYDQGFLDEKPDPYKLKGFWPCTPFIIGTKPNDSLYPTPFYVQLKPVIDQLHNLFNKIFELISAVRRRAVADATFEEVANAINQARDNEVIMVQNFKQLVDAGGINNLIQYLPVQELADAIVQMDQLTDRFKNDFFEFSGVPDIVRGSSDAVETAEAQQIKGSFATLRFSWQQKQIQEMARAGIELMVDLALDKLDDQELFSLMGFQYMDPDDQALFAPALALLRDDISRSIRIEIQTDSTSHMKDEINQIARNNIVETVLGGLDKISQWAENPTTQAYIPIALKTLLFSLRGYSMGKDFEAEVQASVEALAESMSEPQEDQGPSIEQQTLELKKYQTDIEAQLKAQDQIIQAQKLELEAQKMAMSGHFESLQHELDQRMQGFKEFIESSYLNQDGQRMILDEKEKYMTEARLQRDSELKAMEMLRPNEPVKPPTVIINAPKVEAPQVNVPRPEPIPVVRPFF